MNGKTLRNMPMVSIIKARNIVPSIPNLLVKAGVSTENTPNAKTGKVVSRPSMVLESPVSSLISWIKGPTETMAGLRFNEMTNMAINSKTLRFRSGDIQLVNYHKSILPLDNTIVISDAIIQRKEK
jgi:hypothetical protein